jgi:hypothetical protein
MSGFEIGIINIIADNLRDRYQSGFPVLKEIIQNADDAAVNTGRPVQLDFGFTKGFVDADHPLLRGPAIFFLNNGSFTEQDARAVKSFALNSKAGENASIGKFGLGMKSVFHFCEAFFWLAKDGELKKEEILNPWSTDGDYPPLQSVWDDFSPGDANRIRNHLQEVFGKSSRKYASYFLLWLPLRKKSQLVIDGKEVGPIISEFPGEDIQTQLSFLFDSNLPGKLAALLPLLRHLALIQFWNSDETGSLQLEYFVRLSKHSKRNTYPNTDGKNALSGRVVYGPYDNGEKETPLKFAGFETKVSEYGKFRELHNSDYWPKSYVRNDRGQEEPKRDTAEEHCAVTFSRTPAGGNGTLNIQWAVFLPIDAGGEAITFASDFTYNLTLHGCFFVDAGRVRINGLDIRESDLTHPPQSENDLRTAWNYYLFTKGTFMLIIPALSEFVERSRLGVEEVKRLCFALLDSKFYFKYKPHICQQSQWVLQITPDGSLWKGISSNQKILPLPAPPRDEPRRPWKTLPRLSDLDNEFLLVQRDAPHLTGKGIPQWDEDALSRVLDFDSSKVFSSRSLFSYLNLFLEDGSVLPFLSILILQNQLKILIRQGFSRLGSRMSAVTSETQKFVSFVLPEKRFILRSDAHEVIKEIQKVNSNILVLHKDFDSPDLPGKAGLTAIEGIEFLKILDEELKKCEAGGKKHYTEKCREVILEILKGLDRETRKTVFRLGKDLQVIAAYDCQLKDTSSFTLKELEECRNKATLFIYTQGTHLKERLGLAEKLQSVLSEDKVLLLNSDTAEIVLGKDHGIKQCLAEGCLYSLGSTCKTLSDENVRADLIGPVSGVELQDVGPANIRGFRYLLHGNKDLFGEEYSLWVQGYDQNSVWPKLWKQMCQHDERNILVERSYAEKIPQGQWQFLGIKEIRRQEILDDIRKTGHEFISAALLTDEERAEVLLASQHDRELWKQLPLHETIGNDFVSIDDLAYLEPDFSYPFELTEHINIIMKSPFSGLLGLQENPVYIEPFTDKAVIQSILSFLEAHKHFKIILEALYRMVEEFDIGFAKNLRNEKWLVDVKCTPLCPSDVICLAGIDDELSRLIAVEEGTFWQPELLHEKVRKHPYFKQLQVRFFSHDEEGLEKLALLLEHNSDYAIGCLSLNSEDFSVMLSIFGNASFNQKLPGWRILQTVSQHFGLEKCQQCILGAVSKALSNEKLLLVFEWLEQQYNSADEQKRKAIFIAHLQYLKVLSGLNQGAELLRTINLLNQIDEWQPAHKLCSETEGVAPAFLVNKEQQNYLYTMFHHQEEIPGHPGETREGQESQLPEERDLEPELQATVDNLAEYFEQWEGLVPPELICGFVSILGDDERILELSRRFEGKHTLEWIRSKVPWNTNLERGRDGRECWLYGLSYLEVLAKHRLIVEFVSGRETTAASITGEQITVALKDDFSTLAVGKPFYEWPNPNAIYVKIRLRRVTNQQIAPDKFSEYLKKTAEYLLKKLYEQKNPDLTTLWDELNNSEQLDVRVALRLVMRHIPFYLDQLGVQRHDLLKKAYNLWDRARYKAEEYRDIPEQAEMFKTEEEEKRQELQQLIENDQGVQEIVLESVRKKMRDYQYTEENIPFEIFQNADDALVEQLEIESYPDPVIATFPPMEKKHRNRFAVQQVDNLIRFFHWGRPVNSLGTGGFPGRERGFHQDLEKMLVLSSSNKTAAHYLTGKFGLGFKSVLLVSDQPRFLSGRLGVKIVAGIYPKVLNSHQALHQALSQFSSTNNHKPGTVLELPLKRGTNGNILLYFKRLSGILTVFSKTLGRIDLAFSNRKHETAEWLPEKILATPEADLEMGTITIRKDQKDNEMVQTNAIHFRSRNGGSLLVGIGSRGFVSFPSDLPPIWIVAPTREKGNLGFCINGNFDIDAGRARLAAESERNKEEAQRIGKHVGEILCHLYEKTCEDWPAVRKKFRFIGSLSWYEFWESVWSTLTKTWVDPTEKQLDSGVLDVVSDLLGSHSGLGMLITEKPCLPNGLWGEQFQRLISPRNIRYVLRDSLSEKSVFKALSEWELFKEKIDPNSVISEKIFPALGKIRPGFTQKKDQWESLRLAQVLRWLKDGYYRVEPESADILGRVITRDFLDNLFTTKEGEAEYEEITGNLRSLRFKAQDESWYANTHLLRSYSNGPDDDEALRASFAPPKNILHETYNGVAVDFFTVCRKEMTAKANTLAEWVLDASTEHQKENALEYIMNGELGNEVADRLRYKGIHDTWLSNLRLDSEYFSGWEEDEIREMLFRKLPPISVLQRWYDNENYYEQKTHVIAPPNLAKALLNILAWWENHRNEYLKKYEDRTYPDNALLDGLEDDDRSAWLTIFMIGSFHTFGRAKPEQHRNFLTLCRDKGWWEIFTKEKPREHPDEWMGILEEYIDDQVEDGKFEYWMRLFPTIYKFSRDIDQYIDVFYELDKQGNNLNIMQAMAPKTSSDFQGGGISAPPIGKTLGMGVAFVLREMIRKGLFPKNHSNIAQYCYVPLGRVRYLFSKMGCPELENGESPLVKSKTIHDFLCKHVGPEKATFDNTFDIPFQFIAEEPELQEQLFV